jgi:hyperosmotically inducible protein
MRRLIAPAIVAIVLAGSGFAADNKNQQKDHNDAFVAGPENEAQLAKQVRHALLMLPYYSIFDDLAFQLEPGGVVVLEGACPPEPPWDIKKDAEEAVKRVPGVTQVVNRIKELPLSPMDWQIRRAVAQAIYGDPQIAMRYGYQALPPIHVIVDNGHVTLEGVVDNQFDDTLIRTRVNQVPNVFSVTDHLKVLNENSAKK